MLNLVRRLLSLRRENEWQRVLALWGTAAGALCSTRLDREWRVDLARLDLRPHEGIIVLVER